MNIGIFTDTYYPQVNGVATSIMMLEKELTQLGHRVYIFTTTDPGAKKSANVFRLPSLSLSFSPNNRIAFVYPPWLLLKIRSLKLDIVHTHTEFSLGILGKLVSEILRLPMVHTYHTVYEDYVHYILRGYLISRRTARRFSRFFCNRAKAVIAPVDKTYRYLKEIGVARPIVTIPTGLDFSPFAAERFTPEELAHTRRELGIGADDPVIVSVGRLAKEKSADVLINMMPEVLASLPAAKLLFVGDGPYRAGLEQMAQTLGIQQSVVFAGVRPWDTIGKYYRLGNIFATASTSETQGLTYIEAMAARVPVAVKKDPSFEGLIKHGETGFIFNDGKCAAKVVLNALSNPALLQAVTEKGYEAIQPLTARQYAENVERLYIDNQ